MGAGVTKLKKIRNGYLTPLPITTGQAGVVNQCPPPPPPTLASWLPLSGDLSVLLMPRRSAFVAFQCTV